MHRTSLMQRSLVPPVAASRRTGGAVIVVVLALMAMLAFLGLFFYDFVQVEANTSENFSQTSAPLAGIDPEGLMAEAISQLITSPDDAAAERGSVIAADPGGAIQGGTKLSLLAHELGTMRRDSVSGNFKPVDYELRNGRGIRVIPGATPQFAYTGSDSAPNPAVGSPNPTANAAFIINRSAPAQGGTNALSDTNTNSYEPDVDYTYPDVNAFFLAYDYLQPEDLNGNGTLDSGEDLNGDGVLGVARIIKPSFMDPSLYRAMESAFPAPPIDGSNRSRWYVQPTSTQWMLRPHLEHMIPGTTTPRYLVGEFPKITTVAAATGLNIGPWTGSGNDYTGLDADADNDGIFDSIYIDLGLSPVRLSGNRTLQPMAFFKIEDLSGLLDLNAAGNMAEFFRANRAGTVDLNAGVYNYQVAGVNRPVHYSNHGLSRAEVNPMWALFANPATAGITEFPWNAAFYRSTAAGSFNRLQMQNTELAMLLIGSPTTMAQSIGGSFDFTNQLDDLQGRYGDANRIPATVNGQFSAPGNLNINDDSEDTNGNGTLDMGEDTNGNGILDGPVLSRGIHPSDPAGTGSVPISTAAGGARLLAQLGGQGIPFPRYNGNWQSQFVTAGTYQTLVGATGLVEAVADYRTDNAAEVNRYSFSHSERDNPFRPYEIAALHLSDYDYSRAGLFSRTRQLAPFNFNMHEFSRDTRRQFTTESWSRREFTFPYDPLRNFEFNDQCPIDPGMNRFPPRFNAISPPASRHEPYIEDVNRNGFLDLTPMSEDTDGNGRLSPAVISNLDPFRPEVRRLLTTRSYRSGTAPVRNRVYFPQLPLELNRILDDQPADNAPAFDSLGNPNFRELTPHPSFRGLGAPVPALDAMVHGNDLSSFTAPHPVTQYANRFSTPALQEWWARYDRQRLARDIYVLLATLCAPGVDPTAAALDPVVAKEMAQFAVNYVDALDSEDVITRFDYDENLSDGWNPNGTLHVNGVETQKLSIAEVLWIKHDEGSGDVPYTYHKDDKGHHQFLYIELRNGTPFQIDLHEETWRIVRLDPTTVSATMDPTLAANQMASFAFTSTTKFVEPGANFVIAGHDGNVVDKNDVPIASDYYANIDTSDALHEVVVPATGAAIDPDGLVPPTPRCDLDLCHTDDAMEFDLTAIGATFAGTANTTNPKLLYYDDATPDAETRMVLSLQRRRHLFTDGNLPQVATDWIEVDRIDFTNDGGNQFAINADADVATEFVGIRSRERYHHLDNRDEVAILAPAPPAMGSRAFLANHSLYRPHAVNALNAIRRNTVADPVENTTLDMTAAYNSVWQPHHDRDFTSVYELLTVPLFGPDQLTARLRDHDPGKGVEDTSLVNGWADSGAATPVPSLAAKRFVPRISATPPTPDPIPWTRLLNFLALPDPTDQTQRTINSNFVRSRTFGQVNVNTIRTAPVLAGLLDDDVNKPNGLIASNSDFLTDQIDTNRLWWADFKGYRDGGPVEGMNSVGARPFLPPGRFHASLTGTDPAAVGVEHGLLRQRNTGYPPTSMTQVPFGILEARAPGDVTTDAVDVHTRNRLLQKLANNATTRSHCFAIWGGIDFFETEEPTPGQFQVGAKAADVQTCRWFFVVDMTRLEEAYDSRTETFDWRKFIVYRQRLE